MSRISEFFSRFNQEYFFSVPLESQAIYIFLGLYLIIAIATFVLTKKITKINDVYKEFAKSFFWANFAYALTGLFLVFNRYEQVLIFSWRFWHFLLILLVLATNSYFYFVTKRHLDLKTSKLLSRKRKEKWLTKSKKKKK